MNPKIKELIFVASLNLGFVMVFSFSEKIWGAVLLSWILLLIMKHPEKGEVTAQVRLLLCYISFIGTTLISYAIARERMITYSNGYTTEDSAVLFFFGMGLFTSIAIDLFFYLRNRFSR